MGETEPSMSPVEAVLHSYSLYALLGPAAFEQLRAQLEAVVLAAKGGA